MDRSVLRLAGNAAICLAVCYIIIGLTFFLVPNDQLKGFSADFWPSYVNAPFWRRVFQVAQALGATLGVAVVLGVREWTEKKNEAWMGWASLLANVGFALGIIDNVRSLELEAAQGAIFMAADATTRASIVANTAIYNLDSVGLLGFGAVGLWVLVSAHTLGAAKKLSQAQVWMAWGLAAMMWLVVFGYATHIKPLLSVAAGLGGFVLAPAYFAWLGTSLRAAGAEKAVKKGKR